MMTTVELRLRKDDYIIIYVDHSILFSSTNENKFNNFENSTNIFTARAQ